MILICDNCFDWLAAQFPDTELEEYTMGIPRGGKCQNCSDEVGDKHRHQMNDSHRPVLAKRPKDSE